MRLRNYLKMYKNYDSWNKDAVRESFGKTVGVSAITVYRWINSDEFNVVHKDGVMIKLERKRTVWTGNDYGVVKREGKRHE